MRAFFWRLFGWEPDQFIYSARRVVFAHAEVEPYDTSTVIRHAHRDRRVK